MFAIGIRDVRDALHGKADEIQHEFLRASTDLEDVARKILEARGGPEVDQLRKEQEELRVKQQELAKRVNEWREKARDLQSHRTEEGLRSYLGELLETADGRLKAAIERSLMLMDATPEEIERMMEEESRPSEQTQAGRLLERARISYDLRGNDPGQRQRAAIEFSNRPGMALNMAMIGEIEAAIDDPDPLVSEVAILTCIQLYRFRAMRIADLNSAHDAVKWLCNLNSPSVIPVLVEILDHPRTGFVTQGKETVETTNVRSRMIALLRLVKWHTNEARIADQKRKFDPEKEIIAAAERALDLFPDQWTGTLKGG